MKPLYYFVTSVLLLIVSNNALAGTQVHMMPAYIQVKEVAPKKYSFEYCELGYCDTIGNPKGYEAESFTTMGQACYRRGNMYPFAANILKSVTLLIATKMTGGLALTVGLGGMSVVDGIFNTHHDYKADQFAADIIENMPKDEDSSFELPRTDFNRLYDGLVSCHQYYDSTPGVWLEDCNRSFKCKKDLVKELRFSDADINNYSAEYLFQIKMEYERSQW